MHARTPDNRKTREGLTEKTTRARMTTPRTRVTSDTWDEQIVATLPPIHVIFVYRGQERPRRRREKTIAQSLGERKQQHDQSSTPSTRRRTHTPHRHTSLGTHVLKTEVAVSFFNSSGLENLSQLHARIAMFIHTSRAFLSDSLVVLKA